MDPVAHVQRAPVDARPIATAREAFDRLEAACAAFTASGPRALVAGFSSDRLGYAFLGGYQAALARLVAPRSSRRAGLCATEEGGVHPRAIRTRLREGLLTGTKTFATLASEAEVLYVVASEGERSGRNLLRVVAVRTDAPGVVVTPRPETAFAPEVSHAIVRFEDVRISADDVLPGDGYAAYLRPFRTIEDIHVFVATLGFVVRVAREHGWLELVDALASRARNMLELVESDPSSPDTHLELAAAIDACRREISSLPWSRAEPLVRARWERDQGLLWVAEQARRKRTEAARAIRDGTL
jgi:alkylation response protein AidB-like acyl-CoA dehydrogenase